MKSVPGMVWFCAIGVSSGYVMHRGQMPATKLLPNLVSAPKVPKPRKPKSYPDALKVSKETKRPILLFFGTDGCHWCERMIEETFDDSKVKELVSEFVFLHIDWKKNKHLCDRYDVNGYPAYRMVEIINGREIVVKHGSGFKSPTAFIFWLLTSPKEN